MKRLLRCIVLSTVLAAQAAVAATPPRDLQWVGDHWTAWNPPVPPPGAQVHVVVRGDTLWDLAKQYYGDPYLWPQLWEQNRYVLDAHWIYPGDPLFIGPQVVSGDDLAAGTGDGDDSSADDSYGDSDGGGDGEEEANSDPIEGVQTSAEAAGAPRALGDESDIYCSGYIGELEEQFPFRIIGSEFENLTPNIKGTSKQPDEIRVGSLTYYSSDGGDTAKYGLSTGDIIYLDGGRSRGLVAGSLFTALQSGEKVSNPVFGDLIGRFYRYLGRVRVLSVQDETAIAEVIHSCDPIPVGSALIPFQPEPVPLGRVTAMRPVNFPSPAQKLEGAPMIVYAKDDIVNLGQDHVVFIDRGAENDVTPGEIFTVYRLNRPGLPPVVVGEVAVLSVHRRTALAKVIQSRYAMFVGDRLEAK